TDPRVREAYLGEAA
ncbi:MAG: hypothetical protein ACOVN2_09215, partial [Usitatibacteraceae bacterium]